MISYNMGLFDVSNMDKREEEALFLIDGGIERRCCEEYDFNNNKRPCYSGYLFQYTLAGKGKYEIGNTTTDIKEETGILVEIPEASRYYLPKNEREEWIFLYLHFDGFAVNAFANKLRQLCEPPFYLNKNSLPIRMALHLHNRILIGERFKKREGGEFLYRFLCALLREIESAGKEDDCTIVQKAERMMQKEYNILESIEKLAERLELSTAHFTRKFKEETGNTPVAYLTNIKIQGAMNDLLITDETIEAIALNNGFSNGNYFSKVFKKNVGLTPLEYRRKRYQEP